MQLIPIIIRCWYFFLHQLPRQQSSDLLGKQLLKIYHRIFTKNGRSHGGSIHPRFARIVYRHHSKIKAPGSCILHCFILFFWGERRGSLLEGLFGSRSGDLYLGAGFYFPNFTVFRIYDYVQLKKIRLEIGKNQLAKCELQPGNSNLFFPFLSCVLLCLLTLLIYMLT